MCDLMHHSLTNRISGFTGMRHRNFSDLLQIFLHNTEDMRRLRVTDSTFEFISWSIHSTTAFVRFTVEIWDRLLIPYIMEKKLMSRLVSDEHCSPDSVSRNFYSPACSAMICLSKMKMTE
jgi:hypothetical protein